VEVERKSISGCGTISNPSLITKKVGKKDKKINIGVANEEDDKINNIHGIKNQETIM
jgi:hypothetical protein